MNHPLAALENPTVWEAAWAVLRWQNPLGFLFAALLGAAFGSFANVVIYRVPRALSIVKPASHCPNCQKPIPPYHNIPIISYLILGGKSSCCRQTISSRYPVIELLSALIFSALYLLDGLSWVLAFHASWMLLLLMLAAIDLEHYRLPNPLVAAGAVISLLWMIVAPQQSWGDAALGLLTGGAIAGVVMLVSRVLKGQWGGVGDFKLSLALGFTFGMGRFIFLYLITAISAVLAYLIYRKRFSDGRIPMGIFFAVGAWVTIWVGEELVRWYLSLIYFTK
ncbi:prepilin peptidase [bacterium]|nr:prepilin peptidase [bacterium]MBU1881149.1 prepilin peptidase [bacterium]